MRKLFFIWFISGFGLIVSTYAQNSNKISCNSAALDKAVNNYLSFSAPVLDVTVAHNDQKKYVFLDAREFEEYKTSHIGQARFVGYKKFDISTIRDIAKDTPIIVYCSIGYRSEKIATKLIKNGYKNVFNLYGSIFEWVNRGYKLYDDHGMETTTLHTYNKSWGNYVTNQNIHKKY